MCARGFAASWTAFQAIMQEAYKTMVLKGLIRDEAVAPSRKATLLTPGVNDVDVGAAAATAKSSRCC